MPAYITNPEAMTAHAHMNHEKREQYRNEQREYEILEEMLELGEEYVAEAVRDAYEQTDWRDVLFAIVNKKEPEFARLFLERARNSLRSQAITNVDAKPDIDENWQEWCKDCERKVENCDCIDWEPR